KDAMTTQPAKINQQLLSPALLVTAQVQPLDWHASPMSKSRLQTNLEYAIARGFLSILGTLPRSASVALGRWLGYLAYLLPTRLGRTGMRNLEIASRICPS